jgi:hypothetical protein
MLSETNTNICDNTVKYSNQTRLFMKTDDERQEASQMTFLRSLLSITRLRPQENRVATNNLIFQMSFLKLKNTKRIGWTHLRNWGKQHTKADTTKQIIGRRNEGRQKKIWKTQVHFTKIVILRFHCNTIIKLWTYLQHFSVSEFTSSICSIIMRI